MNRKNDTEREWLTPQQAADILGVTRMTVYRYAWAGKINITHLTKRTVRINRREIERLMEGRAPA